MRRARESIIFFDVRERRRLLRFQAVERILHAKKRTLNAAAHALAAEIGERGRRGARFQPRFAIRRRRVDHRVVDRRGLGRPAAIENILARGLHRSCRRRVGADGGERRGARFKNRLFANELIELLFELLLIEQLTAGDAIDLRAQFGDAVFIGKLHFGLTPDQPLEHVIMEGEIGAGHDRPAGHDDERTDNDPEGDRAKAHLPPGVSQRVIGLAAARLRMVVARGLCSLWLWAPRMLVSPAFNRPAGIAALIVGPLAVGH